MKLLFVDPVAPKAYDPDVLERSPLGGTEATIVRIAEGLSSRHGITVSSVQHVRTETSHFGATYSPFGGVKEFNPTHVVVLRAPLALLQAKKQFNTAKLYLWAHDIFCGPGWDKGFQAIQETEATVLVVSHWHRTQLFDFARSLGVTGAIRCKVVYNPIPDSLRPDKTPVDPDKFVFFSSPHKGLKHTLEVFSKFKNFKELENSKLFVANPGYFPDYDLKDVPGVVNLGPLTHSEVIKHVREAFCVLHLNNVFPETFGLVHAEANSVGTPFINSRLGANPEVSDHAAQLLDVMNVEEVIDRLILWKKQGRPKVRGNPMFSTSHILREWVGILK